MARVTETSPRGFWSDNASGVHPALLEAIGQASAGHAPSYGADRWTAALDEAAPEYFGAGARIFPVFNGTGANVIAVQALLRRWERAVASGVSHMVHDESSAPQLVGGIPIATVPDAAGKLDPAALAPALASYDGSVHQARPGAVSVAQATELGTVYSRAELAAVVDVAHAHGARVHLDGARLANAAVGLGCGLVDLTGGLGVDVVSFGGTKNGMLVGDAVVVYDEALADAVDHLRKASTQLASKLRFVSAQLLTLLTTGLWERNARAANGVAALLAARLESELGVLPVHPVDANAVFFALPPAAAARLVAAAPVLAWDPAAGVVRAVASFDSTQEDVAALVGQVRAALAG